MLTPSILRMMLDASTRPLTLLLILLFLLFCLNHFSTKCNVGGGGDTSKIFLLGTTQDLE